MLQHYYLTCYMFQPEWSQTLGENGTHVGVVRCACLMVVKMNFAQRGHLLWPTTSIGVAQDKAGIQVLRVTITTYNQASCMKGPCKQLSPTMNQEAHAQQGHLHQQWDDA